MNTVALSSYSLREQLGPIVIPYTDADGASQTFRQDFPTVIDIASVPGIAADGGMNGVELVAFQVDGIDDPAIDRFAKNARAAGVELVNAAVDLGDLLSTDADRRAADVAELARWITRLAVLGFRFVRINPGSPFARSHGDAPPDHLVSALRGLGEHANNEGVRLLVENHGGPSSDPRWMSALLDAVGSDGVGLLLDLGNFDALLDPLTRAIFAREDGVVADPFDSVDLSSLYEGIDSLAPYAELVHVKAHRVDDDGVVGPIDLPRALRILTAHAYRGPLTIEYEGEGGDTVAKVRAVSGLIAQVASAD